MNNKAQEGTEIYKEIDSRFKFAEKDIEQRNHKC